MDKIFVTVVCITYNHEKYIRQALESMLNQITNFNYEILVHDDASTDNTRNIIREIAKINPNKICPIFQTENQWSKGVNILRQYIFPNVKGKYIAFCEGDDYWVDTGKLQKQIDYMEAHPESSLCIHNAQRVDRNGKKIGSVKTVKKSREVSCEEVILRGGGFCATNSILTPANILKAIPSYFDTMPYDFVIQMYLASCGNTYCFADEMSSYRCMAEGSWTSRMANDPQAYNEHYKKAMEVTLAFNEQTNFRYDKTIQELIIWEQYKFYMRKKEFKRLHEEPYKNCPQRKTLLSYKDKFRVLLGIYAPWVLKCLSTIKHGIKSD